MLPTMNEVKITEILGQEIFILIYFCVLFNKIDALESIHTKANIWQLNNTQNCQDLLHSFASKNT